MLQTTIVFGGEVETKNYNSMREALDGFKAFILSVLGDSSLGKYLAYAEEVDFDLVELKNFLANFPVDGEKFINIQISL